MTMGDRIRGFRLDNGLTQQELADKLGLQKSAIAKYESGRVENIKRSTIEKMSEIFNVAPSFLMGFEDDYAQTVKEEPERYYLNKETEQMAQELFENKELRLLFNAGRNAKAEDLKMVSDMLLRLKKAERHEE